MIRRAYTTVVAVAYLIAVPAGATAPLVRIDADVRDQYYDVYGTNAGEVFASIQRQGLGGKAGLAASGLTESELSFGLSTATTSSSCRLVEVNLRANVVVTLPKHAQPRHLGEDTRRQWEAYEALIEFHEYRHVEIEFQGMQELQARFESETIEATDASADTCNRFVERAIEEQAQITRQRHDAFHAQESRVVREAQAALLREIEDADAELSRQKRELDRLEGQIAAYTEERARYADALDELAAHYGNTLPPDEFVRAQELSAELEVRTDESNEIVDARNGLVTRYNEAIEARAALAVRLSWTR
jgi:predicted secreted Zn-dependent protease